MKPVFLLFGILGVSSPAWSQDACDAILNERLMSRSEIANSAAADYAELSDFCSSTFEEAGQKSSRGGGGKYKFFKASFTSSRESFNRAQSEHCGGLSREQHQQQKYYQFSQALAPGVVEAWKDCKLRSSSLFCTAKPSTSKGRFIVSIYWRPPGTGVTKVSAADIVNGKILSNIAMISPDRVLLPGEIRIPISQEHASDAVEFILNVNFNESTNFTCSVSFSPNFKPRVTNSVADGKFEFAGQWCGQDPVTGQRESRFSISETELAGIRLSSASAREDGRFEFIQKIETSLDYSEKVTERRWIAKIDGDTIIFNGFFHWVSSKTDNGKLSVFQERPDIKYARIAKRC